MDQPQFVLKTTPPRVHRMAVVRPRLDQLWEDLHDRTVLEICAPGGFGKSTLLVQWRRRWLERGALVAWVTLDAQDEPGRFARVLAHAMRVASGRTIFDTIAAQYVAESGRELEALTEILSEVASLATTTVLMLDDGERLPEATVRDALSYLLINAPANLHVVLGTRVALPLPTAELAAHGNFGALGTLDLRLELDESIAILRKRFGTRLELDDCVRLHEMTEGWPIGLQLAAAAIERAPHYHTGVASLSARSGDIERYFIGSLLARLPEPLAQFLTRIAILDQIIPDLCEAVTGCTSASAWLDQLMADTPVLIVAELRGWIRLHPLARDFLMGRFEQLPAGEQVDLHRRAAAWLAERKHFPEAGAHALAAGDESLARTYAERSVRALAARGRLTEAAEWIERLSPESVANDVKLRLVAAWVMALNGRMFESRRIAAEVIRDPATTHPVRFVAALVDGCAAAFADQIGAIPAILAPWPVLPEGVTDQVHVRAYANTFALVALHQGATDRVRELQATTPMVPGNDSLLFAQGIGRALVGFSHLWDGNVHQAEAALRPALVYAERTVGRRNAIACLYAAALAAALYERNLVAPAQALLANRLDVIERLLVPDAVLMAHRTSARIAFSQGDERRALVTLESLQTLGVERRVPRFILFSLAESIRVHALGARRETVDGLLRELDQLAPSFAAADFLPFEPQYRLQVAIAHGYAGLARRDLDHADDALASAASIASMLNCGRQASTIRVLRAVVADQRDAGQGLALLAEAVSLAALQGTERLLEDAHPLAVQMMAGMNAVPSQAPVSMASAAQLAPGQALMRAPRAISATGGLLTPKEAEVLRLLAAGHSNKLIANTMDISDETVKWHLKNLFSKLNAGTRKHAVDRARMMGLIVYEGTPA